MAKNFTQENPLKKLSGTKTQKSEDIKSDQDNQKRKVGRPTIDASGKKKKDYTKTVNIAIPLDLFEKIEIAKVCYGNSLTEYFNFIAMKDITENLEEYKEFADRLNKFKIK